MYINLSFWGIWTLKLNPSKLLMMSSNENTPQETGAAAVAPQPSSLEDFPPLETKDPKNYLQGTFKKFLTMKRADSDAKMSDLSPFVVDKAIKSLLGKKHTSKISTLRSGLLLIEVDQVAEFNKLAKCKKIGDTKVKITEHKQLNTSKGIIFCDNDAVGSMTNEQIKEELSDQDVIEVYRVTKRDGTKTNNYILTFKTSKLPSEIKIGYIKTNVKLYIPNPRRCFNCQSYGHGKTTCTHDTVCVTCGQKGHEYGSDK